jgi:probable selenium-dependent hydroxylase accessory protein YqeC
MSFGFIEPWHLLLPREGGHLLGFMGSGGKTSLLLAAAAVYANDGVPTVLTTTTRCEVLPGMPQFSWAEMQAVAADDLPATFFLHDGLAAPGKWRGLAPEQVDALGGLLPERVVLAEVDGAAKLPLKLHRADEPVWPGRTSLAFVVMGVGAVGGRADQCVHRWGRGAQDWLVGLPGHTVLTWQLVSELLLAPGGYLAQVPDGVPSVLAMTGLSLQDDSIGLFEFVGRAMADPALPLAMFCSEGPDGPMIRVACVERDGDKR